MSCKEQHELQQRLTVQEEAALVSTLKLMASWGWPARIQYLESMAKDLLTAKGNNKPLGRHWYSYFLARHPDVKLQWSRGMDQKRKDAADYAATQRWFTLYTDTCARYSIPPEDQYNMDEKGFAMGIADSYKVIINVEEAVAYTSEPGN